MTDDEILDDILRREGGYVNHPNDRGGPTNYGITLATLAAWRRAPVSADDVQTLSVSEARDIYRAKYLSPFKDVPPELKPQVVDIAVNSGVVRASQLLHHATENRRAPRSINTQLVIERLRFYARLVRANPSQVVFLGGWVNRAVEFL